MAEECTECAICLEAMTASDRTRLAHCLHTYHSKCLANWLKRSPTCPQCRTLADANCACIFMGATGCPYAVNRVDFIRFVTQFVYSRCVETQRQATLQIHGITHITLTTTVCTWWMCGARSRTIATIPIHHIKYYVPIKNMLVMCVSANSVTMPMTLYAVSFQNDAYCQAVQEHLMNLGYQFRNSYAA